MTPAQQSPATQAAHVPAMRLTPLADVALPLGANPGAAAAEPARPGPQGGIATAGGCVFAAAGESFGAAFHRADDAASWATELQLEVSREPWPGGVELRLRIGLHTGETEERAQSYFGPAVHAAAHIAAAGHGGQILVSAVTSALLDRSDLPDLGIYRLQGEVAGVRILQLGDGEHPPLRTEDSRRGNLPLRLGRLIGRDRDLDVVAEALARSPVVTLVGPGGIGKTSLALAAAAQLSGLDRASGAWLVELAGIASSSELPRAVADTLEVPESSGRTLSESILAALQARPALLVLDNCEHVIDGAAELAHAIAQRCPRVRVLCTSREALGAGGEQLIAVTPLDPTGSGAELFNERARAVSSTFDPHAHRDDVEEICCRLDGVPLAIELAAARTRTLTPPDLIERLDDRLRLLTGGPRVSAVRHRTLRATIGWSYDLLTRPQQVLFRRLSIFTATFDVTAARRVAADTELDVVDVDDLLGDLVERSMLIVESGPFGRRFRLLETIGEFAAEQLAQDRFADLIAGRHTRWCLDQVATSTGCSPARPRSKGSLDSPSCGPTSGPASTGPAPAATGTWPTRSFVRSRPSSTCAGRARSATGPNRSSPSHPRPTTTRSPTGSPARAHRYMQRGDHDGYERLVLRYPEPDHALTRYMRAQLHGDGETLVACYPEAVAWLRRNGEDHTAALTEIGGASGLLSTGHFGELDAVVSALADRYRAQGPPTLLYVALTLLGYSAFFQGNPDQAERLFDESAGIDVPDRTISVNKPIEARAAFRRGNPAQAFRILRSHVDELLTTDYTDIAGNAAVEFITTMSAIDRLPDAARVLDYLAATGDYGALASRTLVVDAADRIAAAGGQTPDPEQRLDARHALAYMRDVLTSSLTMSRSPTQRLRAGWPAAGPA